MRTPRYRPHAFLAALLAVATAGCGSLLFGDDGGGGSIVVRGNLAGVLPATDRDIVVFVFTTKEDAVDCEKPDIPDGKSSNRRVVLEAGETAFEVKKVGHGRLVVVFLLDEAGNDADGRIDEGDPVAVLDDPECLLEEVDKHFTIEVDDVMVNFTDAPSGDVGAGRAVADDLTATDEKAN